MLREQPTPPPKKPKNKAQSRAQIRLLRPKQRIALANKLRSQRKTCAQKHGVPRDWPWKDYELIKQKAKEEATRIYKIMEKDGMLPDEDIAREALFKTLMMLREPQSKEMQLKIARTLLEYTKGKPTMKTDVTVRTAEDFLDSIRDA